MKEKKDTVEPSGVDSKENKDAPKLTVPFTNFFLIGVGLTVSVLIFKISITRRKISSY